ncbi:MAG: phosphate ABC transporter permease subunit PstC [Actinomycetales bacterium]|nr:phosphate ABC transporter permease subunit PstC [Actinomycetales bacterium]
MSTVAGVDAVERRPQPTDVSLRPSSARVGERIVKASMIACAAVSIATTIGIVVALLGPALQFFREVSVVRFLTETEWTPRFENPHYGIWPLVSGTLWTTAIALLVAVPLGLGSAVFLAEYASPRVRSTIKPVIELLAGIPSVVYGYFALTFVAPTVLQGLFNVEVGTFSVLSAGLVLGVMIIPTVASLSEDALSAVPSSLREASYGLGANRMRTVTRVVFPAAISGIAAALVLALSRAVGETMIVALAAGSQARMVGSATQEGQTMTGFIAQAASGESVVGSLQYNTLFAVGLTLFVVTLIINIISIRLVQRFREAY